MLLDMLLQTAIGRAS